MNRSQTFQEFLANQGTLIPLGGMVVNLLLTALLAFILSQIYIHFGRTLSNRRAFSRNFIMISTTTMLIITIVKSSLALSLGLVGALSIVRFRAAIKEPEELSYLFLAIAIGLGFGANQRMPTLITFFVILLFIWLSHFRSKTKKDPNLLLTIVSPNGTTVDLDKIIGTLQRTCRSVELRRFDQTQTSLESTFIVDMRDYQSLTQTKNAIQALDENMQIRFLDNQGPVV